MTIQINAPDKDSRNGCSLSGVSKLGGGSAMGPGSFAFIENPCIYGVHMLDYIGIS